MKRYFKTNNYKWFEVAGFVAFVGVILVQRVIRPNVTDAGDLVNFILGVLPNFFAGIAMAISIFIYRPAIFEKFRLSNHQINLIAGLISFLGLWLWEYIQTWTQKKFDWMDVLFSALGAIISITLGLLYVYRNEKKGIYGL